MSAIRLVALDVDGTLLTSGHRVTAATVEQVARVRARGVEVVLTTSRPPRALWPILAELGLVAPAVFIASQGALTGRYTSAGDLHVLAREPMPVALARQVVAGAVAAGRSVNWYSAERWLVPAIDELIATESAIVGCAPEVADLGAETEGPDKLLILAPVGTEDLAGTVPIPAGLTALASTPTHLEVTREDVDKAVSLGRLCAARGIGPEHVMAMGDGPNDLAMLTFAGIAVAPANAHPDALAAADLHADSNDEDGVAHALARLIP